MGNTHRSLSPLQRILLLSLWSLSGLLKLRTQTPLPFLPSSYPAAWLLPRSLYGNGSFKGHRWRFYCYIQHSFYLDLSGACDPTEHCLLETYKNLVSMTRHTLRFSSANIFCLPRWLFPCLQPQEHECSPESVLGSLTLFLSSIPLKEIIYFCFTITDVDSSETCISNLGWHSHISSSPPVFALCRLYYHFRISTLETRLLTCPLTLPNELPLNCSIWTSSTTFFQTIHKEKFRVKFDSIGFYF